MYFRLESSLSEYKRAEQKAREARFDGSKGLKCKSFTRSVKRE